MEEIMKVINNLGHTSDIISDINRYENAVIYRIKNKINGKTYIGQTVQPLARRIDQHRYKARRGLRTKLYAAIRKYGWESFEVDIMEDGFETQEELDVAEILWVKGYGDYNIAIGGNTRIGYSPSLETREKLRIAQTGKVLSEETKHKKRQYRATAATKEKLKEAIKNRSPEENERLRRIRSEMNTGKVRTEEFKRNASERMKSLVVENGGFFPWVDNTVMNASYTRLTKNGYRVLLSKRFMAYKHKHPVSISLGIYDTIDKAMAVADIAKTIRTFIDRDSFVAEALQIAYDNGIFSNQITRKVEGLIGTYKRRGGSYGAQIKWGRKTLHLGVFNSVEEAHQEYKKSYDSLHTYRRMSMHISQEMLDYIASTEGLKLVVYKCPAGRNTIGYGHVVRKGEERLLTTTISEKEAKIILKTDIEEFEAQVVAKFGTSLSQNKFDSMVSFVYNAGIGSATNLKKSDFYTLFKAGKMREAADSLLVWGSSFWGKAPGLKKRRAYEASVFMSDEPDYKDWLKFHNLEGLS